LARHLGHVPQNKSKNVSLSYATAVAGVPSGHTGKNKEEAGRTAFVLRPAMGDNSPKNIN
jgi:hypothetical protein